jgi:uracil-DNA glycosylase family 4
LCRAEHPGWWNAPVPAWGDPHAWLAVVGMAPGKHGANRTGRPFTGDYAGDLLYATLLKFGLATGTYRADPSDDVQLRGALILNTVKCLPPQNKPDPVEIATCRPYFEAALEACPGSVCWWRWGPSPMPPRPARSGFGRPRPGSATAAK